MKKRPKSYIFWTGMLLLFFPGLLHAYLLMPFPGSQNLEAIKLCYYLEKVILPLRIAGALVILWYLVKYFTNNRRWGKVVKISVLVLGLGSFYITDFAFKASTMFEEPKTIKFADAVANKVPESYIVLGVVNNGAAKAYPLVYLGYHHKVQDNVGDLPVLVTYCTMCRTGRVYSPVINGARQSFRLVGARHYNAIIEDESTGTWWYQATGEAAVGPMHGSYLKELPYEQSSLGAWLNKHPGSLILQPDGHFKSDYDDLKDYDIRQAVDKDSTLKNKDSLVRKSWVIGVVLDRKHKAYDWRKMQKICLLNDQFGTTPLLVGLEDDDHTFHVFKRRVDGKTLTFKQDTSGRFTDNETASTWDWEGKCISGASKGKQLAKVQAYQEYWHSWQHFHPGTLFWK
ncbi:DUF3179 domain-containing (seleno)protein [Mucilaginibacter ginsenosidivorans]|uniref:DUF3179 domain-containing protein n=1 Tax=Mucilaginibacter ginsenosidivorans TaxID=398053 RepID=A0A5B8UXS3_9SPHI|nr:DUF3179 domain-containing (seleno)protein [Mucilaginibacter ginsenosidivorans]QEC63206.1 DUF3179 domain-containing protein [Mucilaginibacter ginsenosidivorans]